jgi:hypothetical protein
MRKTGKFKFQSFLFPHRCNFNLNLNPKLNPNSNLNPNVNVWNIIKILI